MEETLRDIAKEISDLINKRKFKKAIQLAESFQYDNSVTWNAHYWFHYGLAELLLHGDGDTQYERAAMCDNFTDEMDGDINRDKAMAYAKLHTVEGVTAAYKSLNRAVWLAGRNKSRLAVLELAWGQVAYSRCMYEKSYNHFAEARRRFRVLGSEADPQWVKNNGYKISKAAARAGIPRNERKILYEQYLELEVQSRLKKTLVFLYWYFGKYGAVIGDIIETIR